MTREVIIGHRRGNQLIFPTPRGGLKFCNKAMFKNSPTGLYSLRIRNGRVTNMELLQIEGDTSQFFIHTTENVEMKESTVRLTSSFKLRVVTTKDKVVISTVKRKEEVISILSKNMEKFPDFYGVNLKKLYGYTIKDRKRSFLGAGTGLVTKLLRQHLVTFYYMNGEIVPIKEISLKNRIYGKVDKVNH